LPTRRDHRALAIGALVVAAGTALRFGVAPGVANARQLRANLTRERAAAAADRIVAAEMKANLALLRSLDTAMSGAGGVGPLEAASGESAGVRAAAALDALALDAGLSEVRVKVLGSGVSPANLWWVRAQVEGTGMYEDVVRFAADAEGTPIPFVLESVEMVPAAQPPAGSGMSAFDAGDAPMHLRAVIGTSVRGPSQHAPPEAGPVRGPRERLSRAKATGVPAASLLAPGDLQQPVVPRLPILSGTVIAAAGRSSAVLAFPGEPARMVRVGEIYRAFVIASVSSGIVVVRDSAGRSHTLRLTRP
jgi:hypothetical protein